LNFYCLHDLANSNSCIQIKEEIVEYPQQCYLFHHWAKYHHVI